MLRAAFSGRFPDNAACAHYLFSVRWPEGFVCPACTGRGLRTWLTSVSFRLVTRMAWKSDLRVALLLFAATLALAPLFSHAWPQFGAQINDHTLKAAATIKGLK